MSKEETLLRTEVDALRATMKDAYVLDVSIVLGISKVLAEAQNGSNNPSDWVNWFENKKVKI